MPQKVNHFLNVLAGSCIGVFIGCCIALYFEYKKYNSLFTEQAAPWNRIIMIWGVITVAILFVVAVAKYAIKEKYKEQ